MDLIKKIETKITVINMISGLFMQMCTIVSGFIVPKIILTYFGSEVNGLISSISQFLSYITLLEGGLASVMMAYLYKPLVEKDNSKISSILVSTQSFYNKIGLIFIVYTLIVGTLYPIIFNCNFSFGYVFSLTIILSTTYLVQYLLSFTLKTLLSADKRVYIVNLSQAFMVVINIILVFVAVHIYPSVHLIKFISCSLFIVQPIIYRRFVNKYYPINWKADKNPELIKDRWNGFSINLAAFIHNSTDVTVLSFFSTLQNISVYGVYGLVTNGLKQLISAMISGFAPVIGQAYAKGNNDELNKQLDVFEYIVFVLLSFCFTMAAVLITPFVAIYTKGISDADYFQPVFGLLIVLSESLYLVKLPHLQLAYSANKFKEITNPAYIEAILNILISIILVQKMGLVGVAIGTIVAMIYRLIFHVWFTEKLINRKQSIFYKKFVIFFFTSSTYCWICSAFFPIIDFSIGSWIFKAIEYAIPLVVVLFVVSKVFFKDELTYVKKYLKK